MGNRSRVSKSGSATANTCLLNHNEDHLSTQMTKQVSSLEGCLLMVGETNPGAHELLPSAISL